MKSTSATTSIGGRAETRASKGITLRRVWTDTPIGRIHARVGGEALDGPPVVLVHGMVISSRYMVPTALELAPLCPVYAVDLPGYGDSVKPHAILGGCASRRELIWLSGPGGVRPATWPSRGPIGLSGTHGRPDRPVRATTARSPDPEFLVGGTRLGLDYHRRLRESRDADNPRNDPNGH